MDLAAYFVGISAIVIAVFLATGLQLWQVIRSDARIDRIEAKLESEIKHQGETLRAEMKSEIQELRAEVRLAAQRVSDAELEQARLNGVNSVLTAQSHTHESAAD